ncbi:hypothetical protein [Clostridium massiliamazoniense]|uniref:hypothetical protein n=1 Tax=Clostridium massiliamazoniense TaxID=1347366 RepID=UPI0006D7E860|nr:hypothetical protein [Clostridium massiliamazoniense]
MSIISLALIAFGILILLSVIIGIIKKSFAIVKFGILIFAFYVIWTYLMSKGFHFNIENFLSNIIK